MKTFESAPLTFIDQTDSRKLEVYIKSNLPTTQIYNKNTGAYTPDWTTGDKLTITTDVFLDSRVMETSEYDETTIKWYKDEISESTEIQKNRNSKVLKITTNELSADPIITYICEATYQGIVSSSRITYVRVDTGKNGADGAPGTSVSIKGSASSVTSVSGTNYYTIKYADGAITAAALGDSYVYNGDLYVCSVLNGSDTTDYFVNVGRIQGPSGEDAKSIILSGSSQVFKVSNTGVISPSTITVVAQTSNTSVKTWTYSTNGGKTFQSTVPDEVSRDGNIITVTGSSMTSNSIVIKASDGTIEDIFTIYKAFDGNTGAPAPIAFLTNENVTFSANAQGQIAGTTITSNIVAYNGTTKVTPTIGTISGVPTGMTITSSTITVSNEVMLTLTISNNSTLGSTSSNMGVISIPVTSPVSTILYLTWSKVNAGTSGNPGAPAYTAILTNESHVFAGDVSNAINGSATTQVLAYKGTAAQTVTISSVNYKTADITDTDTGIAGLKFKCSELSGTSPTITFTCTTSFVSANGTIPIVFTVDGVSFTKMFTYSIAFKGETGATGSTGQTGAQGVPATSYWLVSSASVVQKTATGTITVTPSTLTFTGKSQTGTATPTDYACRWIIAYSTDGTNYTNLYTSSANEKSKSITVSTEYKTIRARMYLAGGTSTLLDEQIIPIVSDGAKGDTGVGISSVTVTYGASTSASTQPTSWQATIPTVAEGSYLWTRTITDYTDTTIADTVTYTYAKQGAKGETGSAGSSVTVTSIQYQASTSATTAPTGTWSNSVISVSAGSYLWTKTTFSDGKIAYGVARQGSDGAAGADAYTVLLTNESHVFAGNISSATAASATTQVLAYKGTAAQTVTIVSVNGVAASTASTATGVTGLSFACSALSGTSPTITFTCTTAFVSPSGTIPIVLSVGGVSITKMFTYSIAFKGATGSTGSASSSYWLVSNASAVQKTSSGDILCTPATLTFTGRTQTGSSTPANYACRWIIATSIDGTAYTDAYTSTANESTVSFATSTTYKAVRVRMYLAGGTATLLDEQIIPFVSDGETGAIGSPGDPGVTFQVYSNNGYALSTSVPTILLQTFAYLGDVEIIAGATFQWYRHNGTDWVAVSGATNAYFTVSRDDVSFSNNYMCKMIFNDIEYVGVVTIEDKNDENKVFASKPSNYFAGDLWIVGTDYVPAGYTVGTILRAEHTNSSYTDGDWVPATKYDDEIKDLRDVVDSYKQHFSVDSTNGLQIGNSSINNDVLTINSVEAATVNADSASFDSLDVIGRYSGGTMLQAPVINLGNFSIVIESNGSLSIIVNT